MLKFLGLETRGGNLVAVFDRGYESYVYRKNGARLDDGTFCLNEESLRKRIDNVVRDNRDASVERNALAVMTGQR